MFFRHALEHVKKNIPANCDAHLEESIFQTHSKYYQIQFQASPVIVFIFYNKACLCSSDQTINLSEHLNFYLIFILQLTTGCCNTFDELFLEDQIQYDHRDTCKQRCCHQLWIIVGVLSLHFCKCC